MSKIRLLMTKKARIKILFSGLTKLDFKITTIFKDWLLLWLLEISASDQPFLSWWDRLQIERARSYCTVSYRVDHRTLRWSKRKSSLSLRTNCYLQTSIACQWPACCVDGSYGCPRDYLDHLTWPNLLKIRSSTCRIE